MFINLTFLARGFVRKKSNNIVSMIEKTTHLVSAVVYGHGLTDVLVTNLINLKLRRSCTPECAIKGDKKIPLVCLVL